MRLSAAFNKFGGPSPFACSLTHSTSRWFWTIGFLDGASRGVDMDIFIQRLPSQATQRAVRDQLRQPLADVGVETYSVEKRHGKTFGKLSILDTRAAQWFLYHYGVPRDSRPHVLPRRQLFWDGRALRMWEDRFEISTHAVQALQLEESRRASERARPSGQHQSNLDSSRFTARALRCGSWVYTESHLAFTPFYEDHRPATVIFGTRQVVILLHSPSADEQRIYCQYFDIDDIVLGAYDDPTVSMKLRVAPKFYKTSSGNDLAAAMSAMNLGASTSGGDEKKLRLTSLDHAHSKVVSTCFVYRITLADRFDIGRVRSLLNRNPRVPTTTTLSTPTIPPTRPLDESFQLLDHDLTDQCRYGYLPFSLLFQTSALAKNGTLHPRTVRALLPGIAEIFQDRGSTTALAALRRFATQIPCAGPGVEAETLSTQRLQDVLFECADEYDRFHYDPEDPYQLAERYQHINLIHKIVVTPVGTYLTGPHPEPTNRVLRKYAEHIDHFVRMVFQDEDGSSLATTLVRTSERFTDALSSYWKGPSQSLAVPSHSLASLTRRCGHSLCGACRLSSMPAHSRSRNLS